MRLLTVIAVLMLCLVAGLRGWSIVRFAAERTDAPADTVRAWAAVPGLAGDALAASLTRMRSPDDLAGARRRAADLTALLSVRPMSAADWLSLAGMRRVIGEPESAVLGALTMSWLTGPNEGNLMLQRGLFGAVQWQALPSDARQRTIADIIGAVLSAQLGDSDFALAKKVLDEEPAPVRHEIAALVAAEGLSLAQIARLGL